MKKIKCYGRQKSVYIKPESSFIRNFFDGDCHKSNLWDTSTSRDVLQDQNIYCDVDNKENSLFLEQLPNLFKLSSDQSHLNVPVREITNCEEDVFSSRCVKAKTRKKKKNANRSNISNVRRKKSQSAINTVEASWSEFLNYSFVIENFETQKEKKLSLSNIVSGNEGSKERQLSFLGCSNVLPACSVSTNEEKKTESSLHLENFRKSKECCPLKAKNSSSGNIRHRSSSFCINTSCNLHESVHETFVLENHKSNFSHESIKLFTSTPVVKKDLLTNHLATNLISFFEHGSKNMCRKLTDIYTTIPTEKCEVLQDASLFYTHGENVSNVTSNRIFNVSNNTSKFSYPEHYKLLTCHSGSQQQDRSLTDARTSSNSLYQKSHSCLSSKSHVHSSSQNDSNEAFQDQLEKLLFTCNQNSVKAFSELYDWSLIKVVKIGEGTYGEVFLITQKRKSCVLKVIPVSHQSKADSSEHLQSIISEVKISKCLSRLRKDRRNCSKNFTEVKSVHVVSGLYPDALIDAWDNFSKSRSTYNVRPDEFSKDQLYVILELDFGGKDMSCFVFKDASEGESVLKQVAISLAIAEEEFLFEHRDLHLGNILIRRNRSKSIAYKLRGQAISIQSCGLHVTLIDFTLSRLHESGCIYYNNLAEDSSLFNQTGDCQFDVYRSMKFHLGNLWHECLLYSNVLWLNFLTIKLIEVSYSRPSTMKHAKGLRNIQKFQEKLHSCECANDCLIKCEIVTTLPTRNPYESRMSEKSRLIARNSTLKSKVIQKE